MRPADYFFWPLEDWIEDNVKDWFIDQRSFFNPIKEAVESVLTVFVNFLETAPFLVIAGAFVLLALRYTTVSTAIFTAISMIVIDVLDIWLATMTSLGMVLTSIFFCALIGIPLGVAAAASKKFDGVLRPVLDVMQTTPSFVYLVPVAMAFGIGLVPGVMATIVFALPPIVRLTTLGIRHVQSELVEAGRAFGANPFQILFDIQLPQAWPSILAGLNQTLMMALSMVVIAALIGGEGLGLQVVQGLGQNNLGRASVGGLGIVLIAIILDRITQGMGQLDRKEQDWLGFFKRLLGPQMTKAEASAAQATGKDGKAVPAE